MCIRDSISVFPLVSGSASDGFTTRAEHAQAGSILEHLGCNALTLARGRVEQHHVRNMDRGFALDHAARLVCLGVGLGVALDDVDVGHDDLIAGHAHDVAALALVLAGGDDHFVTLLDTVHFCSFAQSTSGASETIFMNFSERSSRVTGPKMRVPIGSCLLLSSTAALPSKRISEPSGRRTPERVRTTTAS